MFRFRMEDENELTNDQFDTLTKIFRDYPGADFVLEDSWTEGFVEWSAKVTLTDAEDGEVRSWTIDTDGQGYVSS